MNTDLLLAGISLLTWGLGEGMFFIFTPVYLEQLGASPLLVGSILGISGIAMTLVHIPAGYLADRFGRLPLLRLAWIMGTLATALMAATQRLPVFTLGLVLYGFTTFVIAPLNSYITAARGRLSPARAMTLVSAMYNAGAMLGPLLGGWIGSVAGLRLAYAGATGVFALSTAMMFFLRPQPRQNGDSEEVPSLFGNQHYWSLLGMAFAVMFVTYLPQPLTPNFLVNERGVSLKALGFLSMLNNLGNMSLNILLGHLPPRLGLTLAQGAVGLFALALWQGKHLAWYGLGYFLLGGYRVARPLLAAQVRSLIHESQMGLAYGFVETVNSLPIILAPPLAGLLYAWHPEAIYPLTLLAILAVIGISLRVL